MRHRYVWPTLVLALLVWLLIRPSGESFYLGGIQVHEADHGMVHVAIEVHGQ